MLYARGTGQLPRWPRSFLGGLLLHLRLKKVCPLSVSRVLARSLRPLCFFSLSSSFPKCCSLSFSKESSTCYCGAPLYPRYEMSPVQGGHPGSVRPVGRYVAWTRSNLGKLFHMALKETMSLMAIKRGFTNICDQCCTKCHWRGGNGVCESPCSFRLPMHPRPPPSKLALLS